MVSSFALLVRDRVAVPRRSGGLATLAVLLSVIVNGAFLLASGGTREYPEGRAYAIVGMVLPVLAWFSRSANAFSATLCLGLWAGYYVLGGPLIWPFYLLVPVLVLGIVTWRVPELHGTLGWLAWGRIDRSVLLWIVLSALTAGLALCLWFFLLNPPVHDELELIPEVGTPLLLLGMLLFSAGNAALEEVIWRGVLYQALDAALGRTWLVILLQALSFGLAHYGGFPRGALGVAMAASYGVMMGIVRHRSGGLLAPWVSHVVADLVIFILVLTLMGP